MPVSPFELMAGKTKVAQDQRPDITDALPGIGAVVGAGVGLAHPKKLLSREASNFAAHHRILAAALGASAGASLGYIPGALRTTQQYMDGRQQVKTAGPLLRLLLARLNRRVVGDERFRPAPDRAAASY